MRARERLYDRYGYGGYSAGDEPPYFDEDPRGLEVKYVGLFAGRGALEIPAQNLGGTISMLAEKYPVARAVLRHKFPATLSDRHGLRRH